MDTTNNEQWEEPMDAISEAYVDVMDIIGALDQLSEAVRSNRQTDALSLVTAMKTLLEGRVVGVLEWGMVELSEALDSDEPDSNLDDARDRLRVGMALERASP